MKIYLGPAGIPTSAKNTEHGIKQLKKAGLNAMEIQFTYGYQYMTLKKAKKIGRLAKQKNIRLSIHAPYYINLCQQDKTKLERSKKYILESAKRAEMLDAKIVVFHPGAYIKLSKEKAMEKMISVCQELSRKTTVKLGLEVTGKQGQFGTLEENIKVSEKAKNCVPVVDFAHMFARRAGKINYKEIFQKLETLNLKEYHFHFSGVNFTKKEENIGNEKNHEPISVKRPPFEPLAKEVLKSGKDTTIICESPLLEKDSIKMKKIIEK